MTKRCTLRCKTCFIDFENDQGIELSLTEIKKVSDYLEKPIWVDITGGEPFLRDDLAKICALFDGRSININTNSFDPKHIKKVTEDIRKETDAELCISLSIDGFEDVNDDIRQKGCFKRSLETLNLLKELGGVRVKVNTVLCDRNYPQIIEFMGFIRGLEPDFHSIIFLRGVEDRSPYRLPTTKELESIQEDVFRIWKTYDFGFFDLRSRLLQSYMRCMYRSSVEVLKQKRQVPRCLASKAHLVCYANGDIALCEMLPPIGNIRMNPLSQIMSSDNTKKQKEQIDGGCCHCHHNCNLVDNILLNPVNYPRLIGGMF